MSLRTLAATAVATLAFASMFTSTAEARQLYWTGQGYAQTSGQCRAFASADGEVGVRNSCIYDYGIQPEVCNSAPVVAVQNISLNSWGSDFTCEVRVDIYVP